MKLMLGAAVAAAILATGIGPASGSAHAQAALRAPDIAEIGDLGMVQLSREQFRRQFKGRIFSDRLRFEGFAASPLFSPDGAPQRHLNFYLNHAATVSCGLDARLKEGLEAMPLEGSYMRVSGTVEDYHSNGTLNVLLSHCELNPVP